MKHAEFGKIDDDGLVAACMSVSGDDVSIGKTAPHDMTNGMSSGYTKCDCSMSVKGERKRHYGQCAYGHDERRVPLYHGPHPKCSHRRLETNL